jgi:hypothetical protein
MKKCLFVLAIVALLIVALPVLAQEELDEIYVTADGTLLFAHPSEWKFEVDMDGTMVVFDKNTTIYIYSPDQIIGRGWLMSDPVQMVNAILTEWSREGDEVSEVIALESNGRSAAMGYYIHEGYPGLLLLVKLSDGSLGGIEAVGNQGETQILGEATALAIADTLDVIEGNVMTTAGLNQAWLDTISALEPGTNF